MLWFISCAGFVTSLHPKPFSCVEEIQGIQGRDLTLPCKAPDYLNHPHLQWSFSNGEDPSQILMYDTKSGHSISSPTWGNHVELDRFKVEFGDGSLRLMDPRHSQHTGSFVCVFSVPHSTHMERNDVTIDDLVGEVTNTVTDQRWWLFILQPQKFHDVTKR